MELKPEKVWKLFEIEGFQILIQLGYHDDGAEDKHHVTISSPMNGVMVAIALGFLREELAQEAFDGAEEGLALAAMRKYAFRFIQGLDQDA